MKKAINYDILNKYKKRIGGNIVAVQNKILFGESAYATIECAKRVDRLTNTSYDVAARKADERIEQNNREYAATYKRAALFSAK